MTQSPAGGESAQQRRYRRARLLLALAFALLLAAGLANILVGLRAIESERMVAHTYEVREAARQVLSDVKDAETGERGYVLTGVATYLEPYDSALASWRPNYEALLARVSDNPPQHRRIEALLPILESRYAELKTAVELRRSGRPADAVHSIRTNRGKQLMDDIRDRVETFRQEELRLLGERQSEASAMRRWLFALFAVSFAAAVALALVLARAAQHYVAELRARSAELEAEARHRRDAEETLRQAHKMEAVGQLTGGIAHDFNNLLTVVLGNLDLMRRRLADQSAPLDRLPTDLGRRIDGAEQGAKSAAQLTHRLLAFSRRQALTPARVDLNRLISGMSDLLARTLSESIHVETVLAGGLWPTHADENQLENALLNLAINARDAMPEGGRLTVETGNILLDDAYAARFGDVAPGQYVLLSVSDTGCGIPPAALERVFEPFFTTKPAGEGSGLGLAMVHGFVKQSGGHVRLYSEVGVGTTVRIYLPRLSEAEQPASPPAARALAAPPERARPDETILLVEDNESVRAFTREALEELGYNVLEAADAASALALLNAAPRVDLLFTDVILPGGVDGRQLAERAVASRSGLPVLYTTGYTRNAIVHHGRLDANVQLLPKPYTRQNLAGKVRELIDGKR
ncbi:MAG: CHASE3 domain-containing protein [Hyphomonadaceae bacterium]|nr:CHASE3 domain-containing protein [Hyphomonadaceae bacterium]